MMNPYPEYKPSGVEWLGEVPTHWQIKKAGWYLSAEKGSRASELTKEYCGQNEGNFPVYSGQTGNSGVMAKIDSHEFDFGNEGVLFSTTVGAKAMHLSHIKGKFSLSQNCMIIHSPSDALFTRFYYYHLEPLFKYERGLIPDHMQASFRMEDLYEYKFALPDLMEQKSIAHFLDLETARIDSLISEKESFIQLLQEKRQAMISHAVTKGLNNRVKVESSGVDWIGDMPKHWELTKLRYIGQCQNGINIGGDSFGSGYPFVSYGDVYNNKALPEKVKGLVESTAQDREIYSIQAGDVLFTRTSETIDEIGFTSVCHTDMPEAVFAGFLIRFRPKKNAIVPLFSEYYFQNEKLRAFFVKEMNLVTRASLSQELLKRMPVPLPPENEQREIAEYLSNKDKKINELIKETKSSIEFLKEHRTALISAAVTGKIDVREVV